MKLTFYTLTLANNCLLYKTHLDIGPFLGSDWRRSRPENKFLNSTSFSKEHLKARTKRCFRDKRTLQLFTSQLQAVVQVGITSNKLSSCEVLDCL